MHFVKRIAAPTAAEPPCCQQVHRIAATVGHQRAIRGFVDVDVADSKAAPRDEPRQIPPHPRRQVNPGHRLAARCPKQAFGVANVQSQEHCPRDSADAVPEFLPAAEPPPSVNQIEARKPSDEMRDLLDRVPLARLDRDDDIASRRRHADR